MMIVHETGHALGAWLTGGRVDRVVLHPLAISRTDVAPNPRPLIVAWAGPAWGAAAPLLAWALLARTRGRLVFLARFFAGFCLIANGAYLGAAPLLAVGDAADLLALGAPLWSLVAFGAVGTGAGLALLSGVARDFGLRGGPAARGAGAAVAGALGVLVAGMLAWAALA